jgi:hypothetical protein
VGPDGIDTATTRFILDFTRIPDPYRQVAKELCYAMLSGPVPAGEARPTVATVRTYFTDVIRFLNWADRQGKPLGALTEHDLEDFQRFLIASVPTVDGRASARVGARKFWLWRHALASGGLRFDPLRVDGWSEPLTQRGATENATSRIPEEVLGPLIAWSMRFVDDFSVDILAADRLWRGPKPAGTKSPASLPVRVQELLDRHIAENRALPGWRGKPDTKALARALGSSPAALSGYRELIHQTAAIVGVVPDAFDIGPVRGLLDGRPWIPAIVTDHTACDGLATLARHLLTACYIVISFLSGARDGEIKHLTRGALEIERDQDGHAYRWKMHSLAFKGEPDPAGVRATWSIGEPAARAIAVLEELQPPGTELLFTNLQHCPGFRSGAINEVVAVGSTNNHLNAFATWINDYCQAHARPDSITRADGRSWHPTSSQFRRTLAWFIARRPGGVIAGALAYRHHGIQVFEGYAGTSDSGFRAEVESEQALARGEHLMAAIEAHDHTELTGPAGPEAARRLETLAAHDRFQGRVIVDENRLRRLMTRHDPGIYPGEYVTCVHDRAKALCERARHSGSEGLPDHGGCQPLACHNVALTPQNALSWEREIERVTLLLSTPTLLPPLLRHRLQTRRAEMTTFLHRNATPKDLP